MEDVFAKIPGYGDKYLVAERGRTIYRMPGWHEVAQFSDPPRVTLYRNGKRWQPYVHTLIERIFG